MTMTNYLRVFLTFARNSLVRDMTFRMNFLIDLVSSMGWVLINLAFYTLIFQYHAGHRRRHRLGRNTSSSSSSPRAC